MLLSSLFAKLIKLLLPFDFVGYVQNISNYSYVYDVFFFIWNKTVDLFSILYMLSIYNVSNLNIFLCMNVDVKKL